MTSEADVKRAVVKQFKDRGHYARRIEDSFSVGFPDLVLIPKDYPVFFTEAKIVGVDRQTFGPTPRQFVELQRMAISKHSVPTLLGWRAGVYYLHPYAEKAQLKDCVTNLDDPEEKIVDLFKRYYHERIAK